MMDRELCLKLSLREAILPSVTQDMGNPPWDGASSRVLILRLSPIGDVEGSTSHLVLFAECRRALPSAYLDFAFFPDARDRGILAAQGAPLFYGLESGRTPADFDLILVSNAFSLELLNLAYLFASPGIPARASQRAAAGPPCPIVILGGSNAASSGSLLLPSTGAEEASDALVDGIFFGEGEGAVGELALALTAPGRSRTERLEAASRVEGFWAALSGRRASRRIARPYPPPLLSYPILNTDVAGTARLQISSGCPGYCSFCLEGWESRPYREFPLAEILGSARELKAATGAGSLEIYSYNFNTHSRVFDLVFELNRIFHRVNFMSQRLDILADSSALSGAELAAGKRSFTLGIEGISERMRAFYRKGVDEAQIDASIRALCLPAVREIKLFYILAGIEDDRDLGEFTAFLARTAETRRLQSPGQRIILSAGYLARLPFTPLQYAPLCLDRERLDAVARRVEGACAAAGIEFRMAVDFEEYYCDQLLALGGGKLAAWLEATAAKGLMYDSGLSRGTGADLESFAHGAGLLDEAFLGEKPEDWRPPLGFIDDNHAALRRQYELAASFAPRGGGLAAPASPGLEWLHRLERLMAAKRGFPSTLVRVELPPALAQAREEYRASWLLRRIAAASKEGQAAVFAVEEALFSRGSRLEGMAERFWGLAYYSLRGPDCARMEAAARAAGFEPAREPPPCELVEATLDFPAAMAAEAESALKAWLAEERVDFIETREAGAGAAPSRRLRVSARDARKAILHEALLSLHAAAKGEEPRFAMDLRLGHKARLPELLSRLSPAGRRSASLRMLSY